MHCATRNTLTNTVTVNTSQQPPSCSEYVLLSGSDYDALRNPFNADPEFSVVLWAWGASILIWVVGLGIGLLYSMIRRNLK